MTEEKKEVTSEVTPEMINGWKEKFGDIYSAVLADNKTYIYRPMKRVEYKSVIANPEASRSYMEEQIVLKCLVHPALSPTDLSAEKAGTISTLTDLIMAASNFGVNEEPVKL